MGKYSFRSNTGFTHGEHPFSPPLVSASTRSEAAANGFVGQGGSGAGLSCPVQCVVHTYLTAGLEPCCDLFSRVEQREQHLGQHREHDAGEHARLAGADAEQKSAMGGRVGLRVGKGHDDDEPAADYPRSVEPKAHAGSSGLPAGDLFSRQIPEDTEDLAQFSGP